MEASFAGVILSLAVLFGAHLLALRQIEALEAPMARCRLHRWERTEDGIVCKACGMHPTVD